jgi:hypothetical protein
MPPKLNARFIGVELYFDHLDEGKRFYGETLGLISAMRCPATSRAWSRNGPLFASNVRAWNPTLARQGSDLSGGSQSG